ncbi:MAG: hypothetical protein N2Z84_02290 [Atribacterota bacterium]|nr:hypothetical protein [Atribacterota bacterium]
MVRKVRDSQVKLFLNTFKELLREKQFHPYREKQKNLRTVDELGISIKEWYEHLLELTPDDFQYVTDEGNVCGPDKWVFQKKICGKIIYIRLRIDADKRKAICESFHD